MRKEIVGNILVALVNLMSFVVVTAELGSGVKTWSYELKEITSKTSDPEKFDIDLSVERVSRGVYAISGEVLLNMDIVEGDSNSIQVKAYRSAQGDNDYKVLPMQVPKMHFFKMLNTHYKDVVMNTIKKCSDMPVFEDKFQPPLEKRTYKLDACQFSQDGLPNHLQEGFYKLTIAGSGDVNWQVDIVVEVTPDL